MHASPETITVPLQKLIACPDNVRKTGASEGIDEMKANIAALGLLHPLTVRKASRGKFAVVAGQRRLLALSALAADGRLPQDAGVACHLISGTVDAVEVSLAENAVRLPMHPADQFDAFAALIEKGHTPGDVAARFGVTEATVKKRLKLARVSPVIIAAYRQDKLSFEQVAAFTVTDDALAQERVFEALPPWSSEPGDIRAALTEGEIAATDGRVRFVTLAAYEAAGGEVRRDLFSEGDDGVFIADASLLDRLVLGKLEAIADEVRAEGWKWVEARAEFDYEARAVFEHRHPSPVPLSGDDEAELEALSREHYLLTEDADAEDEEAASRFAQIKARMAQLEDRASAYTPETIAIAGAVVTLGYRSEVHILRGLVRAEDAPEAEGDSDKNPKPAHSAALVESLTAMRSAALGASLAQNPDMALAAVTHGLVLRAFDLHGQSSLQLAATPTRYREATTGSEALEECRTAWAERIPADAEALWKWCVSQDRETLLSLLAFCAGATVDSIQAKHDARGAGRVAHASALAAALGFDMAQWFTPTAANYFARVSRTVILEALAQAKGGKRRAWEKLKKAELASLAERELAGSGWLPQPLTA